MKPTKQQTRQMAALHFACVATSIGLLFSSAAQAQVVHDDDVLVEGRICSSDGNFCAVGENFLDFGPSGAQLELKVKDNHPAIGFESPNPDSADWVVSVLNENFIIENDEANSRPFVIQNGAGNNAFLIDSLGSVAIGTSVAAAPLNIFRNDGTAQVLVEETSSVSVPRTLLRLVSAGSNVKFELDNTMMGESWAFTNSGIDFRMSRQGSGAVEFRVDNTGDAYLEGLLFENSDRNAKTDVETVDAQAILEKVLELPIAEWAYKESPESRHIGPMAQDFHAAFATGTTDTKLASIDTSGVALASIQALAKENQELKAELLELKVLVMQLLPRTAQN